MNHPLYVGIDVAGNSLVVGIVDATGKKLGNPKTYRNNLPAAEQLVADLIAACDIHQANQLFCATEATGFYDWHILEYLTQSPELAACQPKLFRLNPRQVKAFTQVSSQTDKTDRNDAFFIANCLRFTQPEHPFNANVDYLPLQRLTRFRKHLVEQMTVEKNYFLESVSQVFGLSSSPAIFIGLRGDELCFPRRVFLP